MEDQTLRSWWSRDYQSPVLVQGSSILVPTTYIIIIIFPTNIREGCDDAMMHFQSIGNNEMSKAMLVTFLSLV